MQKQFRLGSDRQFQYVYRRGKRVSCGELTLVYVSGRDRRIGFSVSKKVGCAVVRNKVKRRLRECVRPMMHDLSKGKYVIIARPEAAGCSFDTLCDRVRHLFRRAGLLNTEGNRSHS